MPKITALIYVLVAMALINFVFLVLFLESNAHKSTLLSFTPSANPEPPMADNYTDYFRGTIDTYKVGQRLILRGNLTFAQDIKLFLRFKSGVEKKSTVKFNIKFEGISCSNIVTRLILNSINVKFDSKTCTVLKGNYLFDNFDPITIGKVINFVPARELGVNVWYFGMYNDLGTYLCYNIRVLVTQH